MIITANAPEVADTQRFTKNVSMSEGFRDRDRSRSSTVFKNSHPDPEKGSLP